MSGVRRVLFLVAFLASFSFGAVAVAQDADPSPTPAVVSTPDGPIEETADDAGRVLDRSANLENWELLVAFILPVVMALIIRSEWGRPAQAVATFIVSAVVVIGKYALEGGFSGFSGDTLVASILKVFALTIPFYYGWWKPTEIAPKIQDASNR